MLNIVTKKSCEPNLVPIMSEIRRIFGLVFAKHYTSLLVNAINHPDSKDSKSILDCFSDINHNYFDDQIAKYPENKIYDKLLQLYSGEGFDEENMFMHFFQNLSENKISAKQFFATQKHLLNTKDQNTISSYLIDIERDQRELIDVDFIALKNNESVIGFALIHVMQQASKTIVHIRQVATLIQHRGNFNLILQELINRYPQAIIEANQRNANHQDKRAYLEKHEIIDSKDATFGYSARYKGFETKNNLLLSLIEYANITSEKRDARYEATLGIKGYGRFFEAESIGNKKLVPDVIRNFSDDTQLNLSSSPKL